MNELEYTFAVARIRALEASLLTDQVIDQLVNSPGEKQCLELLRERGWGDGGNDLDAEEMLKTEEKKTWEVIIFLYEIVPQSESGDQRSLHGSAQ